MSVLARLFEGTGVDPEAFLTTYPDEVAVGHGDVSRFGELAGLALWDDLEALVRTSPPGHPPIVYGDGGQRPMPPREAAQALERGATVTIEEGDGVDPVIARFSREIGRALGLAGDDCKALIVVSPPGPAVPVHLDGIEVLVAHLRGEKVWTYAPNERVPFPDTGYFPGAAGTGERGERPPLYDARPLAEDRPAMTEVTLRPGSVLFLPRGFWHGTRSTETSVSITFRLRNPAAYRVVVEGIARALARHAAWRRPVAGLRGSHAWRSRAEGVLAPLVAQLAGDLTVEDIGASIVDRHAGPVMVRDPEHMLELRTDSERALLVARGGKDGSRPRALRLEPDLVPLARWLLDQPALREAEAVHASDAAPATVGKLLDWLVRANVLVRDGAVG